MRNLNSLIFARSLLKTSLAWSQLFLLVWFMMGVCLLDQYLETCLSPPITKHRWVDVLSHFSLIQQSCVAPGVSQVFGYLFLPMNPFRNLMFFATNFSYSAAWCAEQDFAPRAVAGRENGDHGWWKTISFFFGSSDQGMKISELPPLAGPVVLGHQIGNYTIHLQHSVTLLGKVNEFVAGILNCEFGKSWTCLDLNSPGGKRDIGELQAEGGIIPVCWMDKCVSSSALRCCRTVTTAGFVSSRLRHCGHKRVMLDVLQAQLCNIWVQVTLPFSWAMGIALLLVTQPPIASFLSVLHKPSNSPSETRPAATNRFSGNFWSFILAV